MWSNSTFWCLYYGWSWKIVDKASVLSTHKFQALSLPKFVSMHKIFLAACALCLFHSDGICATIATSRLLDDGQITIDSLKTITLCGDCLRRSRCCPYCQSLNRETSLEKRRENSLLLRNIKVMTDAKTGSKFLCVTYPLSWRKVGQWHIRREMHLWCEQFSYLYSMLVPLNWTVWPSKRKVKYSRH